MKPEDVGLRRLGVDPGGEGAFDRSYSVSKEDRVGEGEISGTRAVSAREAEGCSSAYLATASLTCSIA